jgi:hypothetical protein
MADTQTHGSGPDFSRVFVLYGALRSGTTLFRLLLDHHPKISCPGERDFMIDYADPPTTRLDTEALARDRILKASGLSLPGAETGAEAFAEMVTEELARSEAVLVLVIHRHLGRLLDLMPGCQFIHLVRDPRDVARSSIGMGWAGNTWYGIGHWLRTEGAWKRESPRIGAENEHRLRYEDLIANPTEELGRVCAFMGLDYDPAMMDYAQNSSYAALDPKLTSQWQTKQSPAEISHVEHRAGALLIDLGYEPSGHARGAPGPLERAQLWLQNKTGIWRTRFRRYGVIDPLLEALARRPGLGWIGRGAQARMSAAKIARLK